MIHRRHIPAAALAGILLLAGCGGPPQSPTAGGSEVADTAAARRISLQQAVAYYTVELERHPDHAGAQHGLGTAYAGLGDELAARRHWQAALALEPGRHETRLLLARALAAAGDDSAALAHAAKVTAGQPDNDVAWQVVAAAAERNGDQAAAFAAHLQLLRLLPDAAGARARAGAFVARYARAQAAAGHGAEALRAARLGLQLCPDDRDLLLAQAAGQAAAGQLLLARHTLTGLRQRLPDDAEVAGELAELQVRLGRPDEALALWRDQRARRPLTGAEQVQYAATLLLTGDPVGAREALLAAGDELPSSVMQQRARLLAKAGDTGAALQALHRGLAREFTEGNARLAAEWEEQRGQAEAALGLYRQLCARKPGDRLAALAAARLLAQRGEFGPAFRLLATARRESGAEAKLDAALRNTAERWLQTAGPGELAERRAAAVAVLGELPLLEMAAADAYAAAGMDSMAVAVLNGRVPANTPGRAGRLARSYWRMGDAAALAAVLPAALAEQPDDAWLRGHRAALLARRGGADARVAEAEFRALLKLYPGRYDGRVKLWLAELARAAGQLADADRYYAEAFAAGADPRYRVRRARCRELAGDGRGAELLYRQRIEEMPDDWRARFGLARLQTRQGRLAEAHAQWQRLAQDWSRAALPGYMLGYYAYATGDLPAALAAFAATRQRRPDLWEAAYAYATVADKLGRRAEALAAAEQAQKLAPDRARPAWLRARLLRLAGRRDEAEEILRPLLVMANANPELRLLQAYLQRDAGDAAGAAATLTVHLRAQPGDREARTLLADIYTDAARAQFAAGALPEAERYAAAALALDPPQGDALLILAETTMRRGDAAGALARWRDYQRRGGTRSVHGRAGSALQALGRSDEALAEFRAALAAGERDTAPYAALAEDALRRRDLRQALVYYGQWLELAPTDEHGRLRSAAARSAAGRTGDAIADYQRVLAVNPASLAATQELADLYRSRGELGAAARVYEALVRAVPDNPSAWHNLGLLYREQGNLPGAAAAMTRAAELAPANRPLLLTAAKIKAENGEYSAAYALAGRAGGAGEDFRLAICRRWGEALAAAGDDSGALHCFTRMTELAPARWEGWHQRGLVRQRRGELAAAARDLMRAVQLAPPGQAPRVALGDVYAAQGLPEAALAEYARAVELQPGNDAAAARAAVLCAQTGREDTARRWLDRVRDREQPGARLAAGLLAMRRGDLAAARRDLTRAVELDPRAPAGYIALAQVLDRAGDLPGALTALRQAQTLSPGDARLAAQEGALRGRQHDDAGAEAAYRRALAIAPDGAMWHNLAEVLRRTGRPDEAEAAYRAALADPRFQFRAYAMNGLGLIAAGRGARSAAAAQFRAALAADARYAEPAVNLAALYRAAGDAAAARAAAKQALERDRTAHRAHYLLALLDEAAGERVTAQREIGEALQRAPDNGDYRALAARLGR